MKNVATVALLVVFLLAKPAQAEEFQFKLNGRIYLVSRETVGASKSVTRAYHETITMPDGKKLERDTWSFYLTTGVVEVRGDTFFCTAGSIYRFDENGLCEDLIKTPGMGIITKIKLGDENSEVPSFAPFYVIYGQRSFLGFLVYTAERKWIHIQMPDGMQGGIPNIKGCRKVGNELFILDCERAMPPTTKFSVFMSTYRGKMQVLTWFEKIIYHPQIVWVYGFLVGIVLVFFFALRKRKKSSMAEET